MTLAGWSDAALGNRNSEGRRKLGYSTHRPNSSQPFAIGLVPSTLRGPFHPLQWTSKFTRDLAKSSPGGEVYTLGGMADRVAQLREFYAPLVGMSPGMVGLEDCEVS